MRTRRYYGIPCWPVACCWKWWQKPAALLLNAAHVPTSAADRKVPARRAHIFLHWTSPRGPRCLHTGSTGRGQNLWLRRTRGLMKITFLCFWQEATGDLSQHFSYRSNSGRMLKKKWTLAISWHAPPPPSSPAAPHQTEHRFPLFVKLLERRPHISKVFVGATSGPLQVWWRLPSHECRGRTCGRRGWQGGKRGHLLTRRESSCRRLPLNYNSWHKGSAALFVVSGWTENVSPVGGDGT